MLTKETPLIEALRFHPLTREVFQKYGMSCIGCLDSTVETIENAAKMHDIDVEMLLKELNALKSKE